MLFNYLSSGLTFKQMIVSVLVTLPVVLFSLTFHEFAHAFVAYKLGDPTSKNLGRLTLDPLKHLDIFGTLMMLVVGVGWAKPVPVNSRYFKKPKLGMALTALAGPLMNLIISFVTLFLYFLLSFLGVLGKEYSSSFAVNIIFVLEQFIINSVYLNCFLAVFNLIPIPPFDGSRIAFVFLPDKWYFGIMKYERIIQIGLLLLIWTGILTVPISFLTDMIISFNSYIFNLFFSLFV